MEQLLTADEVFGIGIEIEKNGRAEAEKLIHEELTHIGFITRELQELKAEA
jgi:hypothetical protein